MYKMNETIVLKKFAINLKSNVALFVLTNYAELSKEKTIKREGFMPPTLDRLSIIFIIFPRIFL